MVSAQDAHIKELVDSATSALRAGDAQAMALAALGLADLDRVPEAE